MFVSLESEMFDLVLVFLHHNRINKMKREPTEWDTIFANHISDNEIISQYIKNSYSEKK